MAVPTVASGCASSAKSGVEGIGQEIIKQAQAFEKLTEEKDKKKSAEGVSGDLR